MSFKETAAEKSVFFQAILSFNYYFYFIYLLFSLYGIPVYLCIWQLWGFVVFVFIMDQIIY